MLESIFSILFGPTRLAGISDWVPIIIVVLIALYIYGTSTYDHFVERGIPNQKPWVPFIGDLPRAMKYGLIGSDEYLYSIFGRYWGSFLGRQPLIVIADPDMAKQICVKDFSNFVNHQTANILVAPVAEKSLTSLKDDEWRGIRNVVTPTFSGAKMKALVPTINDCAMKLVETINSEIKKKKEFEIKDIVGQYALNAVGATLFGFNVNAHDNSEFTYHAKRVFGETTDKLRLTMLILFNAIPGIIPIFRMLGIYFMGDSEHWRFFIACVEHLMKARQSGDEEAQKRVDFLALLMDAHKNEDSMTSEKATSLMDNTSEIAEQNRQKWSSVGKRELTHIEIVANAMVFFIAGFETTAAATSFALYLLAIKPDEQDKLRNEVDDAWNKCQGNFTYDQIASMPYLDAVFNEVLRLYPPAARTDRVCSADCKIEDLQFKKNDWLMISVWALHHSDKYWHEPLKFRPERFLPENKDAIIPYTFMPFGLGPRNCVGQRLAYLEAKIALCCVLHHFTLHPNHKTEIPLVLKKSTNLTGAKNGIYLDMKPREM